MDDFVMQPLLKYINRENIVSRLERVERSVTEKPSARINTLEELSPTLFAGSNGYIDGNGITLLSAITSTDSGFVQWIDPDTNKINASIAGYVNGLIVKSVLGSTDVTSLAVFGTAGVNGALDEEGGVFLSVDSRGFATLACADGTVNTPGQQGFVIQTQPESTGSNNINRVLFLQTLDPASSTNTYQLGPAVAFEAPNTLAAMEEVGYLLFGFETETVGSEDGKFSVGLTVAGANEDTVMSVNKWGVFSKYPIMSHEMVSNLICDWMIATGNGDWIIVAIGAGTQALIEDEANHHGIVRITQNGANTGVSLFANNTMLLSGGEYVSACFRTQTGTTDTQFLLGFNDNLGAVTAPVDGAWINIDGVTLTGKTSNNSTVSTTATSYTTSTGTWYRMKVVVNSGATTVNYYLYSAAGALLWSDSLSTNIPTAAGRSTNIGLRAYKTSAGTANLLDVDWTAFGCEKVQTR